jgi:putative restriction endonuclease
MSYSKKLPDGTFLGEVPGIPEGRFFRDRQELHDLGLHRGLMRGIAPHGSSVVLSGGYPDDQDLGNEIVYTGEGGRDPASSRQIQDQEFVGGNKHLAENHLNGIPVRVHRGRKYADKMPDEFRYRYDGLYRVAECWDELGRDGFNICRFRLEKISDKEPEDTTPSTSGLKLPVGNVSPGRKESRVTRIVRDSDVSDSVKEIHDYTCQICETRLVTPRGAYAEGCHIKPLGRPHSGPDTSENMLCLCPNCHVQFDELAVWIDDDLKICGEHGGTLRTHPHHTISIDFLRHHRSMGRHK